MTPGRGFVAIRAGNVNIQRLRQRFPQSIGAPFSSGTDGNGILIVEDDEPQVSNAGEAHQPPRIAEWRSNLVALSQKENLYFAAYQDQIHVTIPSGLKQTIPGKPDLIIDLPRSPEGARAGGYIDRVNPHNVNHIIIGNLGDLEILLVACDDGDALAYYTDTIQVAMKLPGYRTYVRPFFHENVGLSAWGLAIHAKSRMIAISSNHREVVVFYYGCTETHTDMSTGATNLKAPDNESFFCASSEELELIEKRLTLFPPLFHIDPAIRWCCFRKVFRLGPEAHNIPSIDFSSDSDGEAHSIVATDIVGSLWIIDIWGEQTKLQRGRLISMYDAPARAHNIMGWGALVLPLEAFKPTKTPEEALGIRPLSLLQVVTKQTPLGSRTEIIFDISCTLDQVEDSSMHHPRWGYGLGGPDNTPPTTLSTPNATTGSRTPSSSEEGLNADDLLSHFRSQSIFDHQSRMYFEQLINSSQEDIDTNREEKWARARQLAGHPNPWQEDAIKVLKKLELETQSKPEAADDQPPKCPVYHLPNKCAILRTYQEDIELIPPATALPRTVCFKALKQHLPDAILPQAHFERLIFHALIVELGLVIVGTQVGRVALLTLTRPEDSFSHFGPVTMFRVDRILPTKTHEAAGLRPHVPLLGFAVAPLQGEQMMERRRWRLVLHYYDHSVLSYELSREGENLLVL